MQISINLSVTRVFIVFLVALLLVRSFVFSETNEISAIRKYLVEKLRSLGVEENQLIDEVLTRQAPTIPLSEVKTIVAYAFGNRILPNGSRVPGPINEKLADLVVEMQQQSGAYVYAQWEIAEAIGNRLSEKQLIVIYPLLDDASNEVYLSTIGVAERIVKLAGDPKSLGKTAIIGFYDHILLPIQTPTSFLF